MSIKDISYEESNQEIILVGEDIFNDNFEINWAKKREKKAL